MKKAVLFAVVALVFVMVLFCGLSEKKEFSFSEIQFTTMGGSITMESGDTFIAVNPHDFFLCGEPENQNKKFAVYSTGIFDFAVCK